MEKAYEMCPHCEEVVELEYKLELQVCPNCKSPIMPCSVCSDEHEDTPCNKCPLETPKYKEMLVSKAMELFNDDDPKYDQSNRSHLETLPNMELSILINQMVSSRNQYETEDDQCNEDED